MHSIRRLPLLFLTLVLAFIFLLALPALATSGPTPAEVVASAWQNTQMADAYTYSATAIQTDHPLPKLQNIGLSPHTQHLFAQGTMNQAEQGLTLNLWQEGSQVGDLNSALQVKIENGQVYGRVGVAEWQPLEEDVSAVFAPGQDMMGYLAAATNVVFLGQETRAGLTFSRYTFTIDGTLLATQLRDQFQADFARRGELPAGIQFQLPRRYVEMIGSGELWLNQDGLPLRQIISMQFPPEGDFRQEVELTTDYANWQTASPSLSFAAPFLNRLSDPETVNQLQTTALVTTLLVGISWFGLTYYRRRWFYRGFVSTIVAIMLLSPLLQTR